MIEIKSVIDYDGWLEVTWAEGDEQLHCESYSGHPEHIQMLRDKAVELGTLLDEYEDMIVKAEQAYTPPTQEEVDREVVMQKVQEYKAYLAATDFKMTVDYYSTLTEAEQLELTAKRKEAREFIRANEVA